VEEVVELVKAEEVAEVNAEAAHQESPTKVDTPQKEESKVESEAVETKVEDKVIVATEEVTTDKQAEVKNESPAKVDSPKSSPKKDSPKAETPTKDDKAEWKLFVVYSLSIRYYLPLSNYFWLYNWPIH
jgi:hypothetical protein